MKLSRETVGEKATATLRELIVNREMVPGQAVTEDAIAQFLGVSRPTVRQALATLEAEGLLTRSPGNRVLQVTSLASSDVAAIFRARRVIELAGVDAAETVSEERFETLWRALARIEHAVEDGDTRGQVEADYGMHEAIVSLLNSPHLSALETQLLARLRLAVVTVRSEDPRADAVLRANRQLCQLITTRQVDKARAQLAARLDESERILIDSLVSRPAAGNRDELRTYQGGQ